MVKHSQVQSKSRLFPIFLCGILERLLSVARQEQKLPLCEQIFALVRTGLEKNSTTKVSFICYSVDVTKVKVVVEETTTFDCRMFAFCSH